MGRTIVLRKCGEHELCQLQQVNGGEWEHTPQARPFTQRVTPPPVDAKQKALEAKLEGSLRTAAVLGDRLAERESHAQTILTRLKGRDEDLAWVHDVAPTLAQLGDALHVAHDLATKLTERTAAVDVLQARLAEGTEALEALVRGFRDLDAQTARALVGAMQLELRGMRGDIDHEREEAVEGRRKVQRQLRTMTERIEER